MPGRASSSTSPPPEPPLAPPPSLPKAEEGAGVKVDGDGADDHGSGSKERGFQVLARAGGDVWPLPKPEDDVWGW